MKKIALLFILLLGFIGSSFASKEITYEIKTPNVVVAGERFRVEFVLTNSQAQKFNAPTFTGLDVLAGPVTYSGHVFHSVNGVATQLSTFTYTYTVQAKEGKKAVIGASSVETVDKGTLTTKSTTIEILDAASQNSNNRSGATSSGTLSQDAVLIRMSVNKNSLYKGEALVATLKIYTQVGISGLESPKLPVFNGFWKQELTLDNQRPTRKNVGGKIYDSQIISQWLVYPQRTGVLEIEQSELTALAQVITQESMGNSMFDNFFGGGSSIETVRRKLIAPAVKVTVKDLPQPQPLGFSGAVGKFTVNAKITTNELTANSGGSIIVELNGTGDFPLIDKPNVEFPTGFEKYDSKQSEKITNTANGTTGSRTWEFPFIARAEGSYTIPAFDFIYFDPLTGKYITINSGDFNIKVLKDHNPNNSAATIVSGVTKEDLQVIGQDIRFIKMDDVKLKERGGFLLWSTTFFVTFFIIILAFFGLLFSLKQRIRNRADIVRTKNKKANSVALRRLKKAKSFMIAGNETGFYEEMLRAMWGYMGDKLAISISDLSKERLRQEFVRRGVDQTQGEEFLNLIADCEMAQYSPMGSIEMNNAYQAALDLIGRLELK